MTASWPDKEVSTTEVEKIKSSVREAREEKRTGKIERDQRTGGGGRKHFWPTLQNPINTRMWDATANGCVQN